jgi:hypothetical protein
MDFPEFNVQAPLPEDGSHRVNTTLRALLEIAVKQPAQTTNNKALVRRST